MTDQTIRVGFVGAGNNTVKADHVTAFFGIVDGGTGGNNKYVDGGGNALPKGNSSDTESAGGETDR